MSKPKWTPGPWFCAETTIYALQDSFPAWYVEGKLQKVNRFDAHVQGHFCPHEEKLANALLIAAAPDLFYALAAVLRAWEGKSGMGTITEMERAVPWARAALAKAQGETP